MIAVLVSITLAVLDHRYQHLESLRALLSLFAYPLQNLSSLPIEASSAVVDVLDSKEDIARRNEQLRRENLMLLARLQQMAALESENMRLRDLVGSSLRIGERALIAELVAVDLDPYRHHVVINKGTLAGAFVGQPVLDAHAVMGQVEHVNPLSSTVVLITDANHALPVQVLRNGLRAIAYGTGRIDQLELPHLPYNADIRMGDRLVTSGLAGPFPPGYPVATVSDVHREPGQAFPTVLATPSANLDRSREALLVWSLAPEPPIPSADPTGDDQRDAVVGMQ